MSGLEDAIAEFTNEADEQLQRISLCLGEIEKGGKEQETINSIYRDIHTVKGSSQLFGFQQMGLLGHAMETSLDPVRKGLTEISPQLVDCLYRGLDIMVGALTEIKATRSEPDIAKTVATLIPQLTELTLRQFDADTVPFRDIDPEHLALPSQTEDTKAAAETPRSTNPNPSEEQKTMVAPKEKPETPPATSLPAPNQKQPEEVQVTDTKAEIAKSKVPPTSEDKSPETIRVQVGLLDNLMNLVGELVLIRNQVLQSQQQTQDHNGQNLSQRLNVVTTELQNEVMKTRMQPIGNVLTKFHRMVRDLSKQLDKKIELTLEGTETELDKTLIEAVKDPLTHVVRNSIDHGLETVEEREAAEKSEAGNITIRSFHEGGQVIVEVADDGRGLDAEIIARKAIERSLISSDRAARMTEREVHNLIFAPGFSTAEKVSNISGRGVGMDVVKTNIERIGGMIELNSVKGKGTTLRLKIPLTLAIVPALVVTSQEERFAIPQVKLVELLRLEKGEAHKDIEMLQGRPVYRLRGTLLPIVSLNHVLQIQEGIDHSIPLSKDSLFGRDDTANVVVLNADNQLFGLLVDQIDDSADIVVKPLSQLLKSIPVYSGATVMGDGKVALTLDVMGLAAVSHIFEGSHNNNEQLKTPTNDKTTNDERNEYLLVDVGADNLYAIPLILVNRLEEFQTSEVCYSGEREVVRYRDSLLPLISVPDFLNLRLHELSTMAVPVNSKMEADLLRAKEGEQLQTPEKMAVVVVKKGDHLFGLQVRRIQDVIEVSEAPLPDIKDRQGIMGNIVHNDGVYVVLDTHGIIDEERRSFGLEEESDRGQASLVNERSKHRLLVAEDSPFFRRQVREALHQSGFPVEVAPDGQEAFQMLDQGSSSRFSLLVSDIEMPNLDGYGLAAKVRGHAKLAQIPMVAVTTKFSKSDIRRGTTAGFNRYLEKLDSSQLVAAIDELLCLGGK